MQTLKKSIDKAYKTTVHEVNWTRKCSIIPLFWWPIALWTSQHRSTSWLVLHSKRKRSRVTWGAPDEWPPTSDPQPKRISVPPGVYNSGFYILCTNVFKQSQKEKNGRGETDNVMLGVKLETTNIKCNSNRAYRGTKQKREILTCKKGLKITKITNSKRWKINEPKMKSHHEQKNEQYFRNNHAGNEIEPGFIKLTDLSCVFTNR